MNGKREPQDFAALMQRWNEKLAKPFAQAIVRKLSRSQIEGMIPDAINISIQNHESGFLVVADGPDAPAALQVICDADWEEVQIARKLEANREVGPAHGDNDPIDPF